MRRLPSGPLAYAALPSLFLLALGVSQYANDTTWALYIPAMMFVAVFLSLEQTREVVRLDFRLPEVWAAGAALIALPLISLIWSPDPYISLIETMGYEVLFAVLAATAAKPSACLRWLPAAAGLAMTPFVVQGVHQAFTAGVNAHGWMHDSNLYAGYLTAGSAAVFCLAVSERKDGHRGNAIAISALALLLLAGAYVGHSRGAWVALTVSLMCTLCATKSHTRLSLPTIALVIAATVAVGVVCTTHKTERDIAQHDHYGQSTNSRLAMWKSTGEMIKDHPLKGVGFGLWHLAYPVYRTNADTDSAGFHAHNDYLEAFATGGIVAGFSVLAIPLLWAYALVRARRTTLEDPWVFVGLSTSAGVLVLQAIVNFIYHDLSPAILVGFCIGAMFAHTREKRDAATAGTARKAIWASVTVAVTVWVLVTYLAMVPTLILGAPHGREARYLGQLMSPRALTLLSRLNPLAADPLYTLGHENMLEGLSEKQPSIRKKDFENAIRYFGLAEQRQGVQAGTSYKRAMLVRLMPNVAEAERVKEATALLQLSLDRNPGYWPSVNEYVRLMAQQGIPENAAPVLQRAINAVPNYQRHNFSMLRSALVSGQLSSPGSNP